MFCAVTVLASWPMPGHARDGRVDLLSVERSEPTSPPKESKPILAPSKKIAVPELDTHVMQEETSIAEPIPERAPPSESSPAEDHSYRIGPGDKVRLTVFGEDDLSQTYKVDGDGVIAMPLIGSVSVKGLTLNQAKVLIQSKLSEGYLVDPNLTLEVVESRPFYILGEIRKPGGYPYVDGMTVLEAVAIGGGYTYRADEDDIRVMRERNGTKEKLTLSPEDKIMPGDIVTITERFF